MNLISFLIVLTSVGASVQQDYLVQLEFKIREERVPPILNYILLNSVEKHDITTQDIVQLSKLDRYDLGQFSEILAQFDLTPSGVFTVANLRAVLAALDYPIGTFYRDLVASLGVASNQGDILQSLGIPPIDFLIAITSNDEDQTYTLLENGNYDREHLDAALAAAGKSANDVYTAARDLILAKVAELDAKEIMTDLQDAGLGRETALILYDVLNITTADVYAVEKFKNIFQNISDYINQNTTLAVFVAPNKLALHESVYEVMSVLIDGVTFKVEAGGVEVFAKKTANLGAHIVELTSEGNRSAFVEPTVEYNSTEECLYVGVDSASTVEVLSLGHDLVTVARAPSLVFTPGAPLVCDGLLYGLARDQSDSQINFDTFYTEEHPQPPPDPVHGTGDSFKPAVLSLAFSLFICFALL